MHVHNLAICSCPQLTTCGWQCPTGKKKHNESYSWVFLLFIVKQNPKVSNCDWAVEIKGVQWQHSRSPCEMLLIHTPAWPELTLRTITCKCRLHHTSISRDKDPLLVIRPWSCRCEQRTLFLWQASQSLIWDLRTTNFGTTGTLVLDLGHTWFSMDCNLPLDGHSSHSCFNHSHGKMQVENYNLLESEGNTFRYVPCIP